MATTTEKSTATLSHHMKEAGHTTNSLSKATGIPRTTLTRHLSNPRTIRLDEIFSLAEALNLTTEQTIEAVTA